MPFVPKLISNNLTKRTRFRSPLESPLAGVTHEIKEALTAVLRGHDSRETTRKSLLVETPLRSSIFFFYFT